MTIRKVANLRKYAIYEWQLRDPVAVGVSTATGQVCPFIRARTRYRRTREGVPRADLGGVPDDGVHHICNSGGFTRIRFRLFFFTASIHQSTEIYHGKTTLPPLRAGRGNVVSFREDDLRSSVCDFT